MPTARPMMPSSESEVSNTRSGPNLRLEVARRAVDAALAPDIFAEHDHARVDAQLVLQRLADRVDHVDTRAGLVGTMDDGRRTSGLGRVASVMVFGSSSQRRRPSAAARPRRRRSVRWWRGRARAGPARARAPGEHRPSTWPASSSHSRSLQSRSSSSARSAPQRVALPLFGLGRIIFVALVVGRGVAVEARHAQPQQRRARARAHMRERLLDPLAPPRSARRHRRRAAECPGRRPGWRRYRRRAIGACSAPRSRSRCPR